MKIYKDEKTSQWVCRKNSAYVKKSYSHELRVTEGHRGYELNLINLKTNRITPIILSASLDVVCKYLSDGYDIISYMKRGRLMHSAIHIG